MRFSTVGSPVPFSDLIGNKLVGSFGIWHPQERLSQREERHSFGTAHAIFLEELVNPAFLLRGPQSSQQAESLLIDPCPFRNSMPASTIPHLTHSRPVYT